MSFLNYKATLVKLSCIAYSLLSVLQEKHNLKIIYSLSTKALCKLVELYIIPRAICYEVILRQFFKGEVNLLSVTVIDLAKQEILLY